MAYGQRIILLLFAQNKSVPSAFTEGLNYMWAKRRTSGYPDGRGRIHLRGGQVQGTNQSITTA